MNVGPVIHFPTRGLTVRVTNCQPDQVLDLAYSRSGLGPDEGHYLTITEHGWYQCNPCLDDEHAYDMDRAPEGQRGAFYAWIVLPTPAMTTTKQTVRSGAPTPAGP